MNVLQITKKVPFPLKDGEVIAIHYLSKGLLSAGCEVDLLSFNTRKHRVEFDGTPDELQHYASLHIIDLDTTPRYWPALKSLMRGSSYNIDRFKSPTMEQALIELLQSKHFDVVQLETVYLTPYIPIIRRYSSALIALRSHNLEGEIWRGLAAKEKQSIRKWYYNLAAQRLIKHERGLKGLVDCLIPLSNIDAAAYREFGFEDEICTVPIGLDLELYESTPRAIKSDKIRVGFIGSLDWKPNQEGIEWFYERVWPELNSLYPQLEFHLAGRNMPEKYKAFKSDDFFIHGEVEDAIAFMTDLDIICVPLFSGSGVKVKILEGMALSKLVISTSKGFEDIPAVDGENAFMAESREDFISVFKNILSGKPDLIRIQIAARETIAAEYGYRSIAENLKTFYYKKSELPTI